MKYFTQHHGSMCSNFQVNKQYEAYNIIVVHYHQKFNCENSPRSYVPRKCFYNQSGLSHFQLDVSPKLNFFKSYPYTILYQYTTYIVCRLKIIIYDFKRKTQSFFNYHFLTSAAVGLLLYYVSICILEDTQSVNLPYRKFDITPFFLVYNGIWHKLTFRTANFQSSHCLGKRVYQSVPIL